VMSFYEDARGTLWMSSAEDGLVRFDRDTQTFTHYAPDTGPSRYVNCIQGDTQGFLWMGTSLGLARFDPARETFSYFDARDGLVIGEGSACFQNQQGVHPRQNWRLHSEFNGFIVTTTVVHNSAKPMTGGIP